MKQLTSSLVCGVWLVVLLACQPASGGDWPESCGKNKSHHSFYGGRHFNDRIIYVNQTIVERSILRKLSFDVHFPPKDHPSTGGTISYVEVLDQYTNGDGACAYLKSGGPGYPFVVLHFKSQRSSGINFITNIYGN